MYTHMEVSWNGDTPKSFMSIRFSIVNNLFGSTPIYLNPHVYNPVYILCMYVVCVLYRFPYTDYLTHCWCEIKFIHARVKMFVIAEARSKKTGGSSHSIKDLRRHASNVSTATPFPISFSDKDTLAQTWNGNDPRLVWEKMGKGKPQ